MIIRNKVGRFGIGLSQFESRITHAGWIRDHNLFSFAWLSIHYKRINRFDEINNFRWPLCIESFRSRLESVPMDVCSWISAMYVIQHCPLASFVALFAHQPTAHFAAMPTKSPWCFIYRSIQVSTLCEVIHIEGETLIDEVVLCTHVIPLLTPLLCRQDVVELEEALNILKALYWNALIHHAVVAWIIEILSREDGAWLPVQCSMPNWSSGPSNQLWDRHITPLMSKPNATSRNWCIDVGQH